MALKKDKQKVLGETFDDERVRGFLNIEGRPGFNKDFLLLERAYRSMNADNFATFVNFFAEAEHDINAKNPLGQTLLEIMQDHPHSMEYRVALKDKGATL